MVRSCVRNSEILLELTLILMGISATSSVKQSGPKTIVTFRNVGIKLCHLKCTENGECLSFEYDIETLTCRLSRAESQNIEKEGYVNLSKNYSDVSSGLCASTTCRLGERCLKTRSGKAVCVQDGKHTEIPPRQKSASANSPLHDACGKGNLARVRHILSRGLVDVNSRNDSNGRTPLMVAALKGHRRIVEFLLRKGANVSHVDNNGDSVLHWACSGGHVGVVKHLLSQYKIDINCRGESGRIPLMKAVHHGQREVLDVLVEMGADVSLVDDNSDNILHSACRGGHVDMVRYVLSKFSVDINSRSKSGKTPLMTAVYYGYRELFDVLVGMGANVSHVDYDGDNVLHYACRGGHVGMVKYLLSNYSVDINSRGMYGRTPLLTTVYYGYREVVDALVEMGANVSLVDDNGDNVLLSACRGGHVDMVRYVLSNFSVDINSRSKSGRLPLMTTAYYGHRNVFDVLVGEGADVSQVDDDGDNVLHWACRGGHDGMVKHLISNYSVDVSIRGKYGRTPLMRAVYYGHIDVFTYLVSLGANMLDVDDHRDNILHRASAGGHAKMVQYITSQDIVDINSRGRYGRTALMRAAYYGEKKAFDVLVRSGCRTDLVDDEGHTILHLASLGGRVEMVKYILSQNMADINARNKDGYTAANIAKREGQLAVYNCLVSSAC